MTDKIKVVNLQATGIRNNETFILEGGEARNGKGDRRLAFDPSDVFFPNNPRRFMSWDGFVKADPPILTPDHRRTRFLSPGWAPTLIREDGSAFPISVGPGELGRYAARVDGLRQRGKDEAIARLAKKAANEDVMSTVLLLIAGSVLIMTIILGLVVAKLKFNQEPPLPPIPPAKAVWLFLLAALGVTSTANTIAAPPADKQGRVKRAPSPRAPKQPSKGPYERILVRGENKIWWDSLPYQELVSHLPLECRYPDNTIFYKVTTCIGGSLAVVFAGAAAIKMGLIGGLEGGWGVSFLLAGILLPPFTLPLGWWLGGKLSPVPIWITTFHGRDTETGAMKLIPYYHTAVGFVDWYEQLMVRPPAKATGEYGGGEERANGSGPHTLPEGIPNWTDTYLAAAQKQKAFESLHAIALSSPFGRALKIGALGVILICMVVVLFLIVALAKG